MKIKSSKYAEIKSLRRKGKSLRDIAESLFAYNFTLPKRQRSIIKELARICKGIHYQPAWKRLFR